MRVTLLEASALYQVKSEYLNSPERKKWVTQTTNPPSPQAMVEEQTARDSNQTWAGTRLLETSRPAPPYFPRASMLRPIGKSVRSGGNSWTVYRLLIQHGPELESDSTLSALQAR
ncbi:MAG TPA: hypothetical protein VE641_18375 [Chthoniobacterales bacterium]|nr:hypothetical protein [Chthoniobacterales bacterium]